MLLNSGLRGTRWFRALFFLPVILGITIQGLVWRLFLYPLGGPVESLLVRGRVGFRRAYAEALQ